MSTLRVANDLASVLVPIGVTGAVLAALCAIIAGVAIARGAGGLSGGAVGVWIPFAMLSSTAGFASQWTPLLVSAGALGTMLIGGGVLRGLVRSAEARTAAGPVHAEITAADAVRVEVERAEPAAARVPVPAESASTGSAPAAPQAPAVVTAPALTGVGTAITGTVSTLTRPSTARAA